MIYKWHVYVHMYIYDIHVIYSMLIFMEFWLECLKSCWLRVPKLEEVRHLCCRLMAGWTRFDLIFCNDSTAASWEFRETTKRQRTWLDWLFTWISKHFHHFWRCLFRGIGIDGDTIAAVRCSWCHSAICQSRLKDLQRSHLIQRGCTLHSLHAKRCLFCKQMEFALLVLFSCSTQKPRQHTTITYMYT